MNESIKRLLPDLPAVIEVMLVGVYSRNNYQNVGTPTKDTCNGTGIFSKENRDLLLPGWKKAGQSQSQFSCFCMYPDPISI